VPFPHWLSQMCPMLKQWLKSTQMVQSSWILDSHLCAIWNTVFLRIVAGDWPKEPIEHSLVEHGSVLYVYRLLDVEQSFTMLSGVEFGAL
jgi:hypothetical protein